MPFWKRGPRDLYELQVKIKEAGVEATNIIFAVDLTDSNTDGGTKTFIEGEGNLHNLDMLNPYQRSIRIMGRTLEKYDNDKLIPVVGFGDIYSKDNLVSPLFEGQPPYGFQGVLDVYEDAIRVAHMSGPTNFAPVIHYALHEVQREWGYHILIILCDGQVSPMHLRSTREAIRLASHFPLSIIIVGVGDGPFKNMKKLDDNIKGRKFDNVNFVEMAKVFAKKVEDEKEHEHDFAFRALYEVPKQYKYAHRYLDPSFNKETQLPNVPQVETSMRILDLMRSISTSEVS